MQQDAEGLQFPCEFPIKVFGREADQIEGCARSIVERHAGVLDDDCIKRRPSRNSRFVAITFTITARSREQLDEIYRDLTAREDILMAL